jgi:dTDP-4-dehydrorhamnose 3,5-epimerase
MNVIPTSLAGVLILEPKVYGDERGFFLESYQRQRYAEALGTDAEFVQDNHSRSKRRVLRGLHLQRQRPQGKLVQVVTGHVWDVAVDINPASSTFKQWVGVDLTAENHRQLYIPPGYAHGICVLSEVADLEYKCTEYYRPEDEVGLLWNDPELAIDWPLTNPILSPRDASNPALEDYLRARR